MPGMRRSTRISAGFNVKRLAETLFAIFGENGAEAFFFEQETDGIAQAGVVIDHQYSLHISRAYGDCNRRSDLFQCLEPLFYNSFTACGRDIFPRDRSLKICKGGFNIMSLSKRSFAEFIGTFLASVWRMRQRGARRGVPRTRHRLRGRGAGVRINSADHGLRDRTHFGMPFESRRVCWIGGRASDFLFRSCRRT